MVLLLVKGVFAVCREDSLVAALWVALFLFVLCFAKVVIAAFCVEVSFIAALRVALFISSGEEDGYAVVAALWVAFFLF